MPTDFLFNNIVREICLPRSIVLFFIVYTVLSLTMILKSHRKSEAIALPRDIVMAPLAIMVGFFNLFKKEENA